MVKQLYFFGWPSRVGGAGTKLAHLLDLLAGDGYGITVVPTHADPAVGLEWVGWMESRGIVVSRFEALPLELEGWGVALCNGEMLVNGWIRTLRERGLKIAWSSEMMWHAPGELGLLMLGWVDTVLYVSVAQRLALEPGYLGAMRMEDERGCRVEGAMDEPWGMLTAAGRREIRWVMTGNYINPAFFPYRERVAREDGGLVVGRVSRPDPHKFPVDFPESWTGLGLRRARFRVLGWSEQLDGIWPRERFDDRWELLAAGSVEVAEFLQGVDLLVYDVHPELSESWGRAVVEAMLCGVIPLIPADPRHHLHLLVPHGTAGFHCASREEFGHYARLLEEDRELRVRMAREARRHAEEVLCCAEEHLEQWRTVFAG